MDRKRLNEILNAFFTYADEEDQEQLVGELREAAKSMGFNSATAMMEFIVRVGADKAGLK